MAFEETFVIAPEVNSKLVFFFDILRDSRWMFKDYLNPDVVLCVVSNDPGEVELLDVALLAGINLELH